MVENSELFVTQSILDIWQGSEYTSGEDLPSPLIPFSFLRA